MSKRKSTITMPTITNRDRIVKFCDWVDSLPINVLDHRLHPEYRARSARLSASDHQAVLVEFARRRDEILPPEAVAASGRQEAVLALVEWLVDNPGASPLTDPAFLREFGMMTRGDLRLALAEVARIAKS